MWKGRSSRATPSKRLSRNSMGSIPRTRRSRSSATTELCEAKYDDDFHKARRSSRPSRKDRSTAASSRMSPANFPLRDGRPCTNRNMQVCDEQNEPIEGLYNPGHHGGRQLRELLQLRHLRPQPGHELQTPSPTCWARISLKRNRIPAAGSRLCPPAAALPERAGAIFPPSAPARSKPGHRWLSHRAGLLFERATTPLLRSPSPARADGRTALRG